jgi:dienelactone hydrolase
MLHKWSSLFLFAGVIVLIAAVRGRAQDSRPVRAAASYYEEELASSNPVRSEQAAELDRYIRSRRPDARRLAQIFRPNYRSEQAYVRSTARLRAEFARSIGYPPPGEVPAEPPQFTRIGEDSIGIYYRVRIPVLAEVHAAGIYITPKGVEGRRPLIISMHGGGGSPEVALFRGGANYHDMVRGGVKRGFVVFAPTHLFRAEGHPPDVRNRMDERLRLVGTSLTAVEIAKIARGLDVLLKRPEVDPNRVAMVGLSYGGYYALVTPALDQRIKVVVSSCYFGVQEYRYERDENGVPRDFQFPDRFSLFQDPELVAMICPRPLEIQAGERDNATHREKGKEFAPRCAAYYERLKRADRFRFVVFPGGHEFWDPTAWEWVERHL